MQARASAAFVGRAGELEELRRALDAAHAGSGATVLVAGEAGIGKTRLASEIARRARESGFEVLLGRAIDFVGTELPYQPFAEALRPLGTVREAASQLRVFEATLTLLSDGAAAAPVLLVLEDLHWADTSTLDLVVWLAHNVEERRVVLLGTYRPDERASAERMRRLADGVRRSGSALVLELGPLEREETAALLATHHMPAALADAIIARSEGNPFFAEELAAAGEQSGDLPRRVRDVLTARVAGLDRRAQSLLRVAASVGRDVSYVLLVAVAALPEREMRESLRAAVEHGVLVADQAGGRFRFRHALLADAIYATILPGEREWLHARVADELARSAAAGAAELAPHWAVAGRSADALTASVAAAREAESVFGLAEALGHLERALSLWDAVPDAAALVGIDLVELCAWTAELATQTRAAPRAVELTRRAIDLVGESDPLRAARLEEALARHLHASGRTEAALDAYTRAVSLVPEEPASPERAQALAALAHGLMQTWRYDESLAIGTQALIHARALGFKPAELRALTVVGSDLTYLGRAAEGLAQLQAALELAERDVDTLGLQRAYVELTDALTMLGRPRKAARLAERALPVFRRYGLDDTVLVANWIEALVAIGEWDEADTASAAAIRALAANYPYMLLMIRADVETGRGQFDGARAHLAAAAATLREDRGLGIYDVCLAELALWEHRWADAADAVRDGLTLAHAPHAAQIRVWLCAKGLRAQAELAALARARRHAGAISAALARAGMLVATARAAAAEASAVTPNAAGWRALAEAEYERAGDVGRPTAWSTAATRWDHLERPPLAAYCRWREAEALVAAGAPRAEATAPLREAQAVAARIGARPLLREIELLANRARLDPAPIAAWPAEAKDGLDELGLTPREAEVLALVARGLTNREIAATLVISVKTASVHVSHILRKLDAPTRLEAAAIAQRLTPPGNTHDSAEADGQEQ